MNPRQYQYCVEIDGTTSYHHDISDALIDVREAIKWPFAIDVPDIIITRRELPDTDEPYRVIYSTYIHA